MSIFNKTRDAKMKVRILIVSAFCGAGVGAVAGFFWLLRDAGDAGQYVFFHWLKFAVADDLGMFNFIRWIGLIPVEMDWLARVEADPKRLAWLRETQRQLYAWVGWGCVAGPTLAALVVSFMNRRENDSATTDEFRKN